MNQPTCPFCRSEHASGWGARDGRAMFRCDDCAVTYFARPIEQAADYQEYYPYLDEFSGERFRWELGIRRSRFRRQLAEVRSFSPHGKTLIDIGAGPGYFCQIAKECGWTARGVEISTPAAGATHFGVDYTTLAEVPDESVDVITCHHVLEHIEDPRDFLATLPRQSCRARSTRGARAAHGALALADAQLARPGSGRRGAVLQSLLPRAHHRLLPSLHAACARARGLRHAASHHRRAVEHVLRAFFWEL